MKHHILEQIMGNLENLAGSAQLSEEETEGFYAFKCNDGDYDGAYGKYWNELQELTRKGEPILDDREVPHDLIDQLRPIYNSLITLAKSRIRRYGNPPTFDELNSM